jgi:hypothetical protein
LDWGRIDRVTSTPMYITDFRSDILVKSSTDLEDTETD